MRKVQLAEPGQPEPNKVLAELGLCQPFLGNSGFQLFLLRFQGFQPLFGGAGQDTRLNGIEHILDTGFCFPKLLLIKGQVGVFFVLQLHDLGDDRIQYGVILDQLSGFGNHQIFQPVLPNRFLLTSPLLFGRCTFIVAVGASRSAGAALPEHQRPAGTTKELGGQQIVVLCLAPGRGLFIFGYLSLHFLKQFKGNNRRDRICNQDIPILQLSYIAAVFEHMLDAVIGQRPTHRVLHALLVHPIPDFFHCSAFVVPLKGLSHEGGGNRVNVKSAFRIQRIAKGAPSPITAAFQNVLRLSPDNLFCQISRIIFGIPFQDGLQDNSLGSF